MRLVKRIQTDYSSTGQISDVPAFSNLVSISFKQVRILPYALNHPRQVAERLKEFEKMHLLRVSALGFVVRLLTGNKNLASEEERPQPEAPKAYQSTEARDTLEATFVDKEKTLENDLVRPIAPHTMSERSILVDLYEAYARANRQR